MILSKILKSLTAAAVLSAALAAPARSVCLADGTVYFVQPPRLVNAVTTSSVAYSPLATYYFTLTLPETAGEPLGQVTFQQAEGAEFVEFRTQDSAAFEGERSRLGAALPIQQVTVDPDKRSLTVRFDPPIAPGKTVTIALQPRQNPGFRGVYQFGVTAFPAGEKAYGQFLGYGRFIIRRRGGV